jgi:hypothetical protein
LAADLTLDKNLFSLPFSRGFQSVSERKLRLGEQRIAVAKLTSEQGIAIGCAGTLINRVPRGLLSAIDWTEKAICEVRGEITAVTDRLAL